jgi:hypothetical protein
VPNLTLPNPARHCREKLRQLQLPAELEAKGASLRGAPGLPTDASTGAVQLALNQVHGPPEAKPALPVGTAAQCLRGRPPTLFETFPLLPPARQDLVAARVQLDSMGRRLELADRERERIQATLRETQVGWS